MADRVEINFTKLAAPASGSAVLLTDQSLKLGPRSAALDSAAGGRFRARRSRGEIQGQGR